MKLRDLIHDKSNVGKKFITSDMQIFTVVDPRTLYKGLREDFDYGLYAVLQHEGKGIKTLPTYSNEVECSPYAVQNAS